LHFWSPPDTVFFRTTRRRKAVAAPEEDSEMQDSDRHRSRTDRPGPSGGGPVTDLRIARIPRVSQAPETTPPAGKAAARIDSRRLFAGGREVVITHDGADYRLRLTASGKLILTK
jgi:hemin uptake protein HemP